MRSLETTIGLCICLGFIFMFVLKFLALPLLCLAGAYWLLTR